MNTTLLIAGYSNARYALDAAMVRQIVWLPALSAVEELPPWIRGVFNLHGTVLPVLDLGLRFGHRREALMTHHRVVVIEQDGRFIGLLVHELHDVVTMATEAIDAADQYQLPGGASRFVRGVAKLGDGVVMLLDVQSLLHEAAELPLPESIDQVMEELPYEQADTEIFRSRAMRQAEVLTESESDSRQPYALFRLGDELFGLDAKVISEFMHRRGMVPIPGSPPYAAGALNRRGEILTVLDVRSLVGTQAHLDTPEVAVVAHGGLSFGILVEKTEDVVAIAEREIRATAGGKNEVCPRMAELGGRVARLIDIENLITALLPAGQAVHAG